MAEWRIYGMIPITTDKQVQEIVDIANKKLGKKIITPDLVIVILQAENEVRYDFVEYLTRGKNNDQ